MMRSLDDMHNTSMGAETKRTLKLIGMALVICAFIGGVIYFVTKFAPAENGTDDMDKLFCTMLLSGKMNQSVAWDTPIHEAQVWLKLCLSAQRYYPYQQVIPEEVVLWYNGGADRIFETYLKPLGV